MELDPGGVLVYLGPTSLTFCLGGRWYFAGPWPRSMLTERLQTTASISDLGLVV